MVLNTGKGAKVTKNIAIRILAIKEGVSSAELDAFGLLIQLIV